MDNYQGTASMNYTDLNIPYNRVIEHKHFENQNTPTTWVTWEYPTEPYYAVNDKVNNSKL